MTQRHRSPEETLREFVAAINGSGRRRGAMSPPPTPPPPRSALAASATFPSLSLFPPLRRPAANSDDARALALSGLSRPVRYRLRSREPMPSPSSRDCNDDGISRAPERMAMSVAASFEELVKSSVRSYAKRRQWQIEGGHEHVGRTADSPCTGAAEEVAKLPIVRVFRASTSFVALPSPSDGRDFSSCEGTSGRCELPIRATFAFDVDVNGSREHIQVTVGGHIVGIAGPDRDMLDSVSFTFDYPALLLALRQQARLVAYRLITQTPAKEADAAHCSTAMPHSVTVAQRSEAVVTPCSSPPLLSILSAAAVATTILTAVEEPCPLRLSSSSPKRKHIAAAVDDCGGTTLLPPKKRICHLGRVSSPIHDALRDGGGR